jgi:protein TonB
VIPLLCAAALHGLGLYGFNWTGEDEIAAVEVVDEGFLMVMPNLADLEEEEPELVEDLGAPLEEIEAADYVPMLADVPSVNVDSVFVQKLDYASLKPRPDLDAAKVVSIPVGPRTGTANAVKGKMANLFDIKDLDRPPSPVFQPAPVFPVALKREVSQATVLVEFIVSNRGKVVEAVAVDSSYRGFEDAAVAGVMRWQFKPGMKGGRPVNTRMRVPLVFRVLDN